MYGLRPYQEREVKFEYKPKLPGKVDSLYGHSLVPGYFTMIKNDTFFYHATHDKDCRRITSHDSTPRPYTDKLVVLGCSFTYGDFLEDCQTHPFILQRLFDQNGMKTKVENWGVGGYCPAQFYIQAQQIVKDTSVKYVVINYAEVQNERTICGRNWRKTHVKYINQVKYQKLIYFPYFTLKDGNLELGHRSMAYDFLPFQRDLALVEYIDNLYCRYEIQNSVDITERALKLTISTLQKKGIKVLLAAIQCGNKSNDMLMKFQKEGYTTINYGVDICDNRYNLQPADGHPNYRANKIYAEKIFAAISGH